MKSSRRLARDGVRGDPRRYLHRVSPLGRSASICARRDGSRKAETACGFGSRQPARVKRGDA
jgi:hypothetical protein